MEQMDNKSFSFITARAYYRRLLELIPHAQKRIVIHAMSVTWGPKTEQLVPHLIDAAARGVKVHIVGDIFTRFESRIPHIHREGMPSWKHTEAISERLRQHGVHVTYIGKVRITNPYKGRTHSKVTIIDDHVFTFGGVNFTDRSFDNHDYMLTIHSSTLADYLQRLVEEIGGGAPFLPERVDNIGSSHQLLFDSGLPGRSIIYDAACEVVASAKKAYYVSQMCPSGRLARLITATDNECYFISPSQAEPPAALDLIINRWRYRITNRYTAPGYIHAKFILTEDRDGSKHIISGSHNFSWRGVAYGTKEIALHSTDPTLWGYLHHFLQKEIRDH